MSTYSSKDDGSGTLFDAMQSEKRLRSVLDGMTDAYYVLDREWRFIEIDQRAPLYFGCTREELASRCIWELYPQYEGSKTWEEYHRTVSENVPAHFETQSAFGGYYFEVHAYPQPDGLAVYLRDLTGRKQAEEALRESERKYERLIKYAPSAIYEIDFQKNRFISVNDAMCVMSGYSREELLAMDPFDIMNEQSGEAFKKRLEQWLKGDEPISNVEYVVKAKDGREAWVALDVSFTRDENGAPLGAMSVAQDISERKRAEEAQRESEERMRSLLDELAKTDSNKNDFLSSLSHELRNPLGAISAGLQLMDITNDEKQARTAKEIIGRQMEQLCHLVDDLLDLTRITNNKITLKRESVDINKLIRQYVRDYRPLFDKKQIKLKLVHSGGKLFANADPVRVKQMTGNLLHNASKFTNKGGEVKLSAYEEEGYAVICVKDSGIGIKPSDLPKLFEPFAQIDSHIDRANGGLGLGLSIVREIARLHGGDAEAESAGEGQGASFYIKLPLEPDGNEPKPDDTSPAEYAGKLKVLFIEDNKDYSEMLCSMLRILGHEAAAAYNGAAGLKAAGEYQPDVIICDIGLPGMNGYEVAKAVTSGGMVKRPYMAALSGYARPQDIEAAKQAGFDRHIAKPVTLEALKQILSAVPQ